MKWRDALSNRRHWDAAADAYQARHGAHIGRPEPRWGIWQLREDELQVLGDVAGKDVLELGCGAAQWSILLASRGARVVGLDNSERQLEHAKKNVASAGARVTLVHAAAEEVPLPDASFDLVFCDHGAMSFADPHRSVPEVARLLRPSGIFAFSHTTPFSMACRGDDDVLGATLRRDYFGLHRVEWPDGMIEFNLPHGEWVRLFVANGLAIEALIEVRPPADASTTYVSAEETRWARAWPFEEIWKLRKAPRG
jgi:SAM-dependent methyltransferase